MFFGGPGGVARRVAAIVDRDARRFNCSHTQTLLRLHKINLWVSEETSIHLMHRKDPITHPGHTCSKGLNKEEHDDHPTTDCPPYPAP